MKHLMHLPLLALAVLLAASAVAGQDEPANETEPAPVAQPQRSTGAFSDPSGDATFDVTSVSWTVDNGTAKIVVEPGGGDMVVALFGGTPRDTSPERWYFFSVANESLVSMDMLEYEEVFATLTGVSGQRVSIEMDVGDWDYACTFAVAHTYRNEPGWVLDDAVPDTESDLRTAWREGDLCDGKADGKVVIVPTVTPEPPGWLEENIPLPHMALAAGALLGAAYAYRRRG